MSQTAAFALSDGLLWPLRRVTRNVRVTVVLSVVLICGSFAAAAALQMRNDRAHALTAAAGFDDRRAGEIALDMGATLNRYAAVGAAFANTATTPETAAALSESGGTALRNIAVLDIRGRLQSELKTSPAAFLPLPPEVLVAARDGHAVVPSRGGRSFAIVFGAGPHIVAVELDARALMPSATEEEALLSTLSGQVVAAGARWQVLPPVEALALGDGGGGVRLVSMPDGNHLVAQRRIAGWPLLAAASSPVGEALQAWYGALPLYLFFLLGPAFTGAWLAVVFVREFERRARTADAVRSLRAKKRSDARLFVRLAEAERRVADAERSKRTFLAHMSHELRTPLNAIIGFSEVIEQGVFGRHPRYSDYARDIGKAGRELHRKIGDILEFADLETDREDLPCRAVDVISALHETVEANAAKAQARGIRLVVTLPQAADASANRAALRRILDNIVANAIQYSQSGDAVRIQARHAEDAVVITVQDQGLGFSEAELGRVGEPFSRFDRPGCATGAGLGLAVATTVARRMGGRLRLASKQGEGTTAELWLAKV